METIFTPGAHVSIGLGRAEYVVEWVGVRDGIACADLVQQYTYTPRRRYGVALSTLTLTY